MTPEPPAPRTDGPEDGDHRPGPVGASESESTRSDAAACRPEGPESLERPEGPETAGAGEPSDRRTPHTPVSAGQRTPLLARSPFALGFFFAGGAVLAWFLYGLIASIFSVLLLVVVAMFLAVGLEPVVQWLTSRMSRPYAVSVVGISALLLLAAFGVAVVPLLTEQVAALISNAPGWLDSLQTNSLVERLDTQYDVIQKAQDYLTSGTLAKNAFGGVLGVGLAVLTGLVNAVMIIVLTLYFLATLPRVEGAFIRLFPATSRPRVQSLTDRILANVGGYVSGAFLVAVAAGLSSLVFLVVVGLGDYAVALAVVVALLDVIPMIGATLGAVIVCAVGFATDLRTGVVCVIFYVVYQQVENYLLYPRVMSRSVDLPGALIVVAALVGAALLGVVGALLAIPTAAALLLLLREVVMPRQDAR